MRSSRNRHLPTLRGWVIYVSLLSSLYLYGYFVVFTPAGWASRTLSFADVVGDLVQLIWLATSLLGLPWHRWEAGVWTGPPEDKEELCRKVGTLVGWYLGTACGLPLYGWMKTYDPFQSSLKTWSSLNKGQRTVYGVSFILISLKTIYWLLKFYYFLPRRILKTYNEPVSKNAEETRLVEVKENSNIEPGEQRKRKEKERELKKVKQRSWVFITLLLTVIALGGLSILACSVSSGCAYHLRHWWFGFVLLLLSTPTLDNPFDYILQGVMWTLVIESCFNYGIRFDQFFY